MTVNITRESATTRGVLVAVSIPIFTAQLRKARLATNQANVRAAMAAAVAYELGSSDSEKGDNTVLQVTYTTSTGEATYTWAKAALTSKGSMVQKTSEDGVVADNTIAAWTTETKVGDSTLGAKTYGTVVINVGVNGQIDSYYLN